MWHLVHLIQVALVAFLVADDKDVGERYDVAVHVDVGRILHSRHTINIKGITVHLGGELVGGVAPHTIRSFLQLSHTWGIILAMAWDINLLRGQEVTSHLHLDGLRGKEVKGYGSITVDNW